jgi:hypothetical protein
MEDLVSSPSAVMTGIMEAACERPRLLLPPDADMAFSKFADGRKICEIDAASHYRSGAPDSWKSELPSAIVRSNNRRRMNEHPDP